MTNNNHKYEIKNSSEIFYINFIKGIIDNNNNLIFFDYNNLIKKEFITYFFDWLFYVNIYNDLYINNINTSEISLVHFKDKGFNEKRIYNKLFINNFIYLNYFDWIFYVNNYDDIKNNNINTYQKTLNHFISYGINENRYCNKFIKDFDWEFYISKYDDIKNFKNKNDALEHFMKYGINENRIINKIYDDKYQNVLYKKYIQSISNITNYDIIIENIEDDIFIKKNINNNIKKVGIAISLYIDNNTPYERIIASKICISSIVLKLQNIPIIIVIDYEITEDYLIFLNNLVIHNNNIEIYRNIENYGVAETKNICIKLLEEKNIDYICLFDDDVEIVKDFTDYIIHIFNNSEIPLLSNFNNYSNYEYINTDNINFIKTKHFTDTNTHDYFGNIIIINKKYLEIHGYYVVFDYKWGVEHVEITERYLSNTIYKGYAVDLSEYIINEQFINDISTLHLHSISVDMSKYNDNVNKLNELSNITYFDYIFDKNKISKIK